MTSIGTLFAFVVVSLAVIVLRYKRPEARRPFRVPGGNVIPVLGVLACVYLMVSLSVMTWVRFLGWLDIGMIIYWFYGRTHSPLVNATEAAARSGAENLANFLKMLGYMLLFNGFCITLLAYLTIFNVTNETLAKWGELDAVLSHIGMHINPEIADRFGLTILLAGAAIAVPVRRCAAGRPAGLPDDRRAGLTSGNPDRRRLHLWTRGTPCLSCDRRDDARSRATEASGRLLSLLAAPAVAGGANQSPRCRADAERRMAGARRLLVEGRHRAGLVPGGSEAH
jgi:hypothetical protein